VLMVRTEEEEVLNRLLYSALAPLIKADDPSLPSSKVSGRTQGGPEFLRLVSMHYACLIVLSSDMPSEYNL
jgi:hypothetical protein